MNKTYAALLLGAILASIGTYGITATVEYISQSAAQQWQNTTSWGASMAMNATAEYFVQSYQAFSQATGGVYGAVNFMNNTWMPVQDCSAILRNMTGVRA